MRIAIVVVLGTVLLQPACKRQKAGDAVERLPKPAAVTYEPAPGAPPPAPSAQESPPDKEEPPAGPPPYDPPSVEPPAPAPKTIAYDRPQDSEPTSPAYESALSMGRVESAKGHHLAAIRFFQKSLHERPDDPSALSELGYSALQVRDFDTAEQATIRAINQAGGHLKAASLYNLARLREAQGRNEEAIDAYLASLAIRPHRGVRERLTRLDPDAVVRSGRRLSALKEAPRPLPAAPTPLPAPPIPAEEPKADPSATPAAPATPATPDRSDF